MKNSPIVGAGYFWRGLGLVTRPRLRRYVIVPLIVNGILFAGFVYALYILTGWVSDWLVEMLPDWLDWLRFVLWPIFMLSAALTFVFGFAIVGNLIAAPFNGLLAEAVEQYLTGQTIDGDGGVKAIVQEVVRTARSELRKLAYLLVRAVPLLLLMLIPGLNVLASLAWLAFGAWMMAIQYADYPMGNHGLTFTEQRRQLGERRLMSMGFGGMVMMVMVVPVLNFVVMPASVAGATAMWVDHYRDSVLHHQNPTPQDPQIGHDS